VTAKSEGIGVTSVGGWGYNRYRRRGEEFPLLVFILGAEKNGIR
jgi:hypothetical protein